MGWGKSDIQRVREWCTCTITITGVQRYYYQLTFTVCNLFISFVSVRGAT